MGEAKKGLLAAPFYFWLLNHPGKRLLFLRGCQVLVESHADIADQ